MSDEIEVVISNEPAEKEDKVTITETDGDTIVDLKPKKEVETSADDARWRAAEAELALLRNQVSNIQQPQYQQPREPGDPFKAQLDSIKERERSLGIQWETKKASKSLNEKDIEDFDNKARELQQERANIAARKAIQEAMPQLIQTQQRQHFQNKHADVYQNANATEYAKGIYQTLRAKGHPESEALVDKAMDEARREFGLAGNKSYAPTEREKQQLTGISGGGGRQVADNTVKMGKAEKAMAMAMYGDRFNGDEKKVYSQWAKGPGIRAKKSYEKQKNQHR